MTRPDLARDHGAVDRRDDAGDAAESTGLLERRNFRIGAAKDAQADAGGFERRVGRSHVALGGGELRLGLLQFLERGSLALMEIADALLDDLRQVELGARLVSGGLGSDEFVLRRDLFGAVDFQQRIASLDLAADVGDQTDNPAGEGRQNDWWWRLH